MAGGFQGTAFGLGGERSQALDNVSGFYQTAPNPSRTLAPGGKLEA